jgi:DNA-binding response OmpR family regulator
VEVNIKNFRELALEKKLLYVESDDDFRDQMQKVLVRFFPEIDALGDGQEAYELFLEKKHDFIITDIILPHLNGIELLKKVKAKGYKPKIVIQSVSSDVEHMIELMYLNIDFFALKPFNNKEFISELYAMLVENENVSTKNVELELSKKQEIVDIYNSIDQAVVVIEGNSIVSVNKAFLDMSQFQDFETLKLEMPHLGALFVVCPESLMALDNETLIQQLIASEPSDRMVYIASQGEHKEYMISYVHQEEAGSYILTFSPISDVMKIYRTSQVTGLPNIVAIRRMLNVINTEHSNYNALLISIKHFGIFSNYYGKRITNDLERFFVERVEKVLKQYDDKRECFLGHFDQNKYIITSPKELKSLLPKIANIHLNEFVIGDKDDKVKDKKEFNHDPIVTLKVYETDADIEKQEVEIHNDFDELNYTA